ncbi:membrane protein [Anaerocolumna cellulosilytica]|uniref:Membrane protein n=1 Tax=Anaerocolumna cellulosilytica TaxID=433286 RepID=A0A6S6RBU3_9FIRM|nr:ABC-2 transporter permease [Anaerocolumna cellulosilytica]MBB5195209.1 ABC-type transport system involved in multi-copper enzyme maturation permease subunit [Anaerocolumna cellulosilytica]BCJ96682.1 membrane protein [Anaerocolumna cellulosilytica]
MIGLIIKDLFNLKKYMKQFGFSCFIFILLAVNLKSPNYFMGMGILLALMMSINAMAYDENAHWDKYALTMPILRKDLVLSKYLLLLLSGVAGSLFTMVIAFILSVFLKLPITIELLAINVSLFFVMLVFSSVILPLIFKLGIEKARLIMAAVAVIPTIVILLIAKAVEKYNIPLPTESQLTIAAFAAPVVVLVIFFLSYNISLSIVSKKEY